MLTTFRRDGRAVPTPVGYGISADTLYFMTDPRTGKVKRLRHTPRVLLAPSTLRGAVTGPEVAGLATEITGADADRARSVITATNRLAWFFLQRRARKQGWDWVVYAVRRASADDPDTEHPGVEHSDITNSDLNPSAAGHHEHEHREDDR